MRTFISKKLSADFPNQEAQDKFVKDFTKPEVAAHVSSVIKGMPFFKELNVFVEPSAGGGAILKHFPGARGFDLEPRTSTTSSAQLVRAYGVSIG